jgi:hypothetical protein
MITGAIAVLGWAAASNTAPFTDGGQVAVIVGLGVVAAAPTLLRARSRMGGLVTSIVAGFGWAMVGLATALIDASLAGRHWLAALAWVAGVAAASWSSLIAEMTALQTWQATRSIPVVFALEMAVPAALIPAISRTPPTHEVTFVLALAVACGGAVVLGSSRVVARAAEPLTNP